MVIIESAMSGLLCYRGSRYVSCCSSAERFLGLNDGKRLENIVTPVYCFIRLNRPVELALSHVTPLLSVQTYCMLFNALPCFDALRQERSTALRPLVDISIRQTRVMPRLAINQCSTKKEKNHELSMTSIALPAISYVIRII